MTTSQNKARGTRYENECVRYLQERGFKVERNRNQTGATPNRYDIIGLEGWAVECKDNAGLPDGAAMDAAVRKADQGVPVLIRKRRNHGVEKSLVILEFHDFVTHVLRKTAEKPAHACAKPS